MAIAVAVVLVLLLETGPGSGFGHAFPPRHWNPVLGRASLALLAITLVIGPLVRLQPGLAWVLRVRRELGAWSAILAIAHVVFVLDEYAGWTLASLWERFDGTAFSADAGLAMANLVGTVALGYGLVLLATSNDLAQRWLGPRWKRLQRTATTLFALAVIHTVFFLFLDTFPRGGFRGLGGPYAGFRWVLIGLVAMVVVIRTVAFWLPRRASARASVEDEESG